MRVHVKTVEKWAREGRLPAVRPGPGTVRFTLESVLELIESTTTTESPSGGKEASSQAAR